MSDPLIKIARDGKTIGEYSLADLGRALRAETVLPTDHFWRVGMEGWERVRYIADTAEEVMKRIDEKNSPERPMGESSPAPPAVSFDYKKLIYLGIGLSVIGAGMKQSYQGKGVLVVVTSGNPFLGTYREEFAKSYPGTAFFTPLSEWIMFAGLVCLGVGLLNRKR